MSYEFSTNSAYDIQALGEEEEEKKKPGQKLQGFGSRSVVSRERGSSSFSVGVGAPRAVLGVSFCLTQRKVPDLLACSPPASCGTLCLLVHAKIRPDPGEL